MRKASRGPRRALVIAAHPDDPEYGCAGTVARWAAEHTDITYLLLTSGDKGSKDPAVRPGRLAALREKEQSRAAAKLGVRDLIFLRHPDGMLENTMELRREIAGIIRQKKPQAVFTIDPWRHYQTHPDHRAAGLAALDAVYAAKEANLFPEQLTPGVGPWRVKEVYLFWTDAPDYWVDISASINRRIAALQRHSSQIDGDLRGHDAWTRKLSSDAARKAGLECDYAEAFKLLKI